jgi:pseudouridylate synthase / pseudouridine kinase
MDLEQLAKQPASKEDGAKGTLGFLVEKGVVHMAVSLLPFFQNIIVKCGDLGVVTVLRIPGPEVGKSQWATQQSSTHDRCVIAWDKSPSRDMVIIKHSPALPLPKDAILNVTGAGDSFVGSLLATSSRNPLAFRKPETLSEAIKCAQRVALLTLQSRFAVSPLLSSTADGPLLADTRQSVDTVD